jgi:hypothetical protein
MFWLTPVIIAMANGEKLEERILGYKKTVDNCQRFSYLL